MSGPLGSSTSLSGKYAEAAAHSARQAWSIQAEALGLPPEQRGPLEQRYRLYCTSAVYDSVLFLEAAIYEFFAAVVMDIPRITRYFSESERNQLEAYWDTQAELLLPGRTGLIIDRYNAALENTGRETFDLESDPARGVRLLLTFCDSLGQRAVARQAGRARSATQDLEAELIEAGFALNPFHAGAPFPDLYLGHGLAEWAVNMVTAFYFEFCSRMDIPNELDSPIVSLETREDRSSR